MRVQYRKDAEWGMIVNLDETVIGSKEIYTGRIFTVRVDTVRLPDGREVTRDIVAHNGAVCVVPIREDGAVLMVRQFRLPAGKALLEIPAGKLEQGEDPNACAVRELEEETGYKAAHVRKLFQCYLAPGYSSELIHCYMATGLTKTQTNFDEGENLELVAVSQEEITRMVLAGELEDAKTIAAILVALRQA